MSGYCLASDWNDGIGAVGLRSVEAIACGRRIEPMWVSGGPGPLLPLSPITWQARQPDCPTTTTYVPRPDWYFFFLFEVLRVMKNVPKFTPMATIGVPTICMILLFLLPFYDRGPERRIERRPVALAAGVATIAAMAYLTYTGAHTGSPNNPPTLTPPAGLTAAQKATFQAGEYVVGESGCLACHVIGANGNNGPGPILTHIASTVPEAQIASTLRNPTPPMPSFKDLPANKFNDVVYFLSTLQ